jgi:hypothetical protein
MHGSEKRTVYILRSDVAIPRERSESLDHSELPVLFSMSPLALRLMDR